jgi:uncharacterized protein (DUF486 family)
MRTVLITAGLLVLSNTFMTLAWYGHLKFRAAWLPVVVLVSWLIALPEYALQVPANRVGSGALSATQLKILQEVVSVTVFMVFAYFYFREVPSWRTALAFALIVGAVVLVLPISFSGTHDGPAGSRPDRVADRVPAR